MRINWLEKGRRSRSEEVILAFRSIGGQIWVGLFLEKDATRQWDEGFARESYSTTCTYILVRVD